MATWNGSSALAIHNFSDAPARATLRLPKDAIGGRWQPIFGVPDGDPTVPGSDGRLTLELEPYGYRWYGRREGV